MSQKRTSGSNEQGNGYFDSEELLSWLLLNPDIVEFDESFMHPLANLEFPGGSLPPGNQTKPMPGSSQPQFNARQQIPPAQNNFTTADGNVAFSQPSASAVPTTTKSSVVKSEPYIPGVEQPFATQLPRSSAAVTPLEATLPKPGKKRQRESLDDIEQRVNQLQSENADLQAHLMNVTQRTTEVQRQRVAMETLMVAKLAAIKGKPDSDQSDLSAIVKQYIDIYADYGKCRQREVAFHLSQLEKLLLPTTTTKMSLWALQQDKSFFQKSQSPMFDMLSSELDLTAEQTEKIQDRRHRVQELLGHLKESLSLIKDIKVAIEKKHACYDSICGGVQDSVTPKQTVMFLMWITKHQEKLAKYIPAFSRSIHHTPNVKFVSDMASKIPEGLPTTANLPPTPCLDEAGNSVDGSNNNNSSSISIITAGGMKSAAAAAAASAGTVTAAGFIGVSGTAVSSPEEVAMLLSPP